MKSNDQKFLVEQIKTKYIEEPHMHIEKLRNLDKKGKRKASSFD